MKHTIFTPVFNRKEQMKDLYLRMLEINYPKGEWEWLIVDDGSTDNLQELLNEFLSEDKIIIRYIKKENGGIHTAQNCAIINAKGEYITRIDSDDYLLPNSLLLKDKYLSMIPIDLKDKVCGVVGACLNKSDMSYRSSILPENFYICRGIDLRNSGAKGDRNFCIKKDVLTDYLIKEYPGTHWIPEGTALWIPIDKKYLTVFVNEPMSVCSEPNENSVSGSLKSPTLANILSGFYMNINLLNDCKFAYGLSAIMKSYLGLALSAIKASKKSKLNYIKIGGGYLRNWYDKVLFFICIVPAYMINYIKA